METLMLFLAFAIPGMILLALIAILVREKNAFVKMLMIMIIIFNIVTVFLI